MTDLTPDPFDLSLEEVEELDALCEEILEQIKENLSAEEMPE